MKKLLLIITIITITSCISDVNFDQVNDLEIKNQFNISLVYFKLNQSDFNNENTNTPTPIKVDFTNIDVFKGSDLTNKLEKVVLKFEIDNTFNKEFDLFFDLQDNNNNSLLLIPFEVDQFEKQIKEIEYLKGTQEFNNLIKATRISVIGNMKQNANITTEQMYINFKSAVDLYLKISDV